MPRITRKPVQELETVIESLYEACYPRIPLDIRRLHPDLPHHRAFKPAIELTLCTLVDEETRCLQRTRDYFRVDFPDFLDYATSELPPTPTLSQFTDDQATFYAPIDPHRLDPFIQVPWLDHVATIHIEDVLIARRSVFVSVTMRFRMLVQFKDRPQLEHLTDQDVPAREIATIILAPPTAKGPPHDLETLPLQEWDRYSITPPIPSDPEWRFSLSGLLVDERLREMERALQALPPSQVGASHEQIAQMRRGAKLNYTQRAEYFEVARLALHLPSYCAFMYDLVVPEKVLAGHRQTSRAHGRKRPKPGPHYTGEPLYKTVKSINIIRPDSSGSAVTTPRAWTPPAYRFAVRGHWRHYQDATVRGHDADGNVVLGKTWVTDYEKGKDKPALPFPTTTEFAKTRTTIYIKQPLAYARDVIASHTSPSLNSEVHPPPAETTTGSAHLGRPTPEWMANERKKLTAALRRTIMVRDHFRCVECGKSAQDENFVRLEVDHIVPVSRWGRTEESNLRTLCRTCNQGKGDGTSG